MPPEWPSLEKVFTEQHRVRPKVPKGAQAVWAECLTHALKHVSFHNDEKAWAQLFSLPKMVLGAPGQRGGENKKKGGPTREVTEKCRRWLAGERGTLWLPPPKKGKGREPVLPSREELEAKAVELAEIGRASCRERV